MGRAKHASVEIHGGGVGKTTGSSMPCARGRSREGTLEEEKIADLQNEQSKMTQECVFYTKTLSQWVVFLSPKTFGQTSDILYPQSLAL